MKDNKLEKRTWVYVGKPADYGIPGCACGNNNCVYSEFKDRLWCEKCQIDFEPEHWGVFSGPILFEVCQLLGMNFDRINLLDNTYIKFDGKYNDASEPIDTILRTPEEISARIQELADKAREFSERTGIVCVGDKVTLK